MATTTGIGLTYDYGQGDGSFIGREDLADVMYNIDPYDTPLVSMTGVGKATAIIHAWPEDILTATATAGSGEGADFSADNLEVPTRQSNITQIWRKDVLISGSELSVANAGISNMYQYQIVKALKEVKRNMEVSAWQIAASASGAGTGTARAMKSIYLFLSGTGEAGGQNAFFVDSTALGGAGTGAATSVTETPYNGLLEKIYAAGGDPHDTFCSPNTKRQLSAFTANSQSRVVAATDRQLVAPVDIYMSDYGQQNIWVDRWIPQTTATATADAVANSSLYVLDRTRVRFAYLRRPRHIPLAAGGDSVRGIVVTEATLEVINTVASHCAHGRLFGIASTTT